MIENTIWEHRYRPQTIEDCILPESIRTTVNDLLSKGNFPNALFSGTGGIGKTTLARAISNQLDADLLYVNASLEGNMDTLRTKISQFVSSVSFTGGRKIVLLDEADYLTCFAENQKIKVVTDNGEIHDKEISTLTDSEFKTLTYDFEKNQLVETSATAFCSGEKEVFEVEFEDGTVMFCTEDHPFFKEDGTKAVISDEILFSINIDETDHLKGNIHESKSLHISHN